MFPTDQNGNGYLYPPAPDALGRPMAPGYTGMPSGQNGQQTPPRGQRGGFICCPVTSREEAVATRVEAFGPAILMPDLGHGMIYYKRFNDKTALADFGVFRYVSPPGGGAAAAGRPAPYRLHLHHLRLRPAPGQHLRPAGPAGGARVLPGI